jgi:hypothetical protein
METQNENQHCRILAKHVNKTVEKREKIKDEFFYISKTGYY